MANYLYSGVELPALPESDYPVAIITTEQVITGHHLYLTTGYYDADEKGFRLRDGCEYLNSSGSPYWSAVSGSTEGLVQSNSLILWTNTDIIGEDGTVYIAASDPIPVGVNPPDPLSLVMGYRVGCAIRANR